MRLWAKCVVVLLAIAAVGAMVLYYGKFHAPVKVGSAEQFWGIVCYIGPQVPPTGVIGGSGGLYPTQGDQAIYYIQWIDYQSLFQVPLAELQTQVDQAVGQMQDKRGTGELAPFLCDALDAYQADGKPPDVRRLIECIRRANFNYTVKGDPDLRQYLLDDEALFEFRWQRAERYWLTLSFEFIWLAGLIVWLAIPWLRRAGRRGWAVHLGMFPLLLFLPYFLGYASYTFTSAFPGGGAFYPCILIRFRRLPFTSLDKWFFQHVPPIFEPLAQPVGPMMGMTGMGAPGPVAVLGLGLALAVGVYVLAAVWRWRTGLVKVKE